MRVYGFMHNSQVDLTNLDAKIYFFTSQKGHLSWHLLVNVINYTMKLLTLTLVSVNNFMIIHKLTEYWAWNLMTKSIFLLGKFDSLISALRCL